MFDGKLVESDKFLSNLLIARELWLKTPIHDVIPELNWWRCGTQACFGGHLCTWDEFRAQGIYSAKTGIPRMMVGGRERAGSQLADFLFGDMSLFESSPEHNTHKQAHAEVLRRLDRAITARRIELAVVTA